MPSAVSPSPPPSLGTRPAEAALAARTPVGGRVLAALLATGSLAVLVTAAVLQPDPRGLETHTQLGLWPCGWYLSTGYPCPTCGMTTAFATAAHRDYWASLKVQPFGALLALFAAISFWGGLHVAMFGSRLGAFGDRLLRPRFMMIAAVLFGLAWMYKIAVVRGLGT